jgi:hypothetical protein
LLKHHGDTGHPQAAQGFGIGLGDGDHFGAVIHAHIAAHDGVQGIHAAQKGGFAGTGQAHEDKDFASGNGE